MFLPLLLMVAVGIKPWNGPDGKPLQNVIKFAKLIDELSELYSPSFSAVLTNFCLRQF